MYLSCVNLGCDALETCRLVASPYRVHAIVEAACEDGASASSEAEQGRVLWRLDSSAATGELRLYIVSPAPPNKHELSNRLCVDEPQVLVKDYRHRVAEVKTGQVWAFRLKANPVRKVLQDKGVVPRDGIVGTLQGAVTVAQQVEWLIKRAAANGFEVVSGATGEPQVVVSQRRKEKFLRAGKTVTLATAQYDGMLRVTDAALFRRALTSGIGRAKGFGCGLLTIARP